MTKNGSAVFGNVAGAFADLAVFLPLVVLLSVENGLSGQMLLFTAGAAYLAAAVIFRVPMSVQPLKSVAVAAVALGASPLEIRLSGALLGVVCLVLLFLKFDQLTKRVPRHLVHGVQLALGILLIAKGLQYIDGQMSFEQAGLVTALIVMMLAASYLRFPLMGGIALLGLIWSLYASSEAPYSVSLVSDVASQDFRIPVLLALLLPQIVLTATNSVVATEDVAVRYFGDRARRVTARRLLQSIGFGNIVSSLLGGLPYCHGSGGVTAHVRGGATDWYSSCIIGAVLIALALLLPSETVMGLQYPAVLLSALLIVVGFFHMSLAAPSFLQLKTLVCLILMGGVALYSRNMLWVLTIGVVYEFLIYVVANSRPAWRLLGESK